jgi:hypothetical protein
LFNKFYIAQLIPRHCVDSFLLQNFNISEILVLHNYLYFTMVIEVRISASYTLPPSVEPASVIFLQ